MVGFSIGSLIARNFATKYDSRLESLTLLCSVFQRSNEGALKRASEDKGLLLVHMHPKRMQKELPFIKSEWIRDGDTQQFLKYLGNLSKEVWTVSFIKYKGIEFTSISKNEEI